MLDLIVMGSLVAILVAWDAATLRRVRVDTLVGGATAVGLSAAALPIGATSAYVVGVLISELLGSTAPVGAYAADA